MIIHDIMLSLIQQLFRGFNFFADLSLLLGESILYNFSSWALSPMHITIFIRWLSILLFLFIGKLDFLVSKGLLFLYDKQNHVLESNQSVILRTSNVSSLILMKIPSITKANSGVYYMYTENIIGSDILTVRVYVEGKFILFNCTHWCWIPAWGFLRKQGNAF